MSLLSFSGLLEHLPSVLTWDLTITWVLPSAMDHALLLRKRPLRTWESGLAAPDVNSV